MTDQEHPNTADAAPEAPVVAQEAPAEAPAPEVGPDEEEPEAAQDGDESAFEEAPEDEAEPVNANALRGVPAGPLPHPRTV